jgi:uncharacterized repeat protein (TIGR01451 family)
MARSSRLPVHVFLSIAGILLVLPLRAPAQNLITNPGFENNPPATFGNNIGYPIAPWTLGTGNASNVVKVDGPGGFNYGNGGPESDADPATGAGVPQHYLDIASGANDFYQAFTVPLCGSAPGQVRQAAFSGWFSTRDNLSGNGAVRIVNGAGTGGTILAQSNVSLPAPPSSQTAPWVQVSGTVNVPAGATISYVISMDNNLNFDQASLTFSTATCASAPLTLRKTWINATVNDSAVITATRNGAVIDTLTSIANTANETDADASPPTVFQGEAVVLAETLPGSNGGAYTSSLACTGGGALSGSTLTVDGTGTPITCTYTNAGPTADLSITKSNNATTVTRGQPTTYDIVISNAGPSTAINAVLKDPAPTNLAGCVLGTPSCAVSSGTATCPVVGSGAGQLSVTNLQGAAGVLIPSLAANSSVTVKLTCTVQ